MGGSDPAIVCEDADIDIASSGIVWGGFNNCGQNCNGIERIYVHRTIFDRFLDKLVQKVQTLRIGNGMDATTDIGPLASDEQRQKIIRLIRKAVGEGAEIKCGGKMISDMDGYFCEPTVLASQQPIESFYKEEWFGPVVMVMPVENDEEAIRYANHSAFGLAASVWTSSAS